MPPRQKEQMLSVAEVCEMQPGDDQNATWINPGFRAEVVKVVHTAAKTSGKPMHICSLRGENGVGEISMTIFRPTIGFDEGDVIEVSGQGLRLTEYKGMLQATLGQKSEVHTVTAAATPPPRRAPVGHARAAADPADEPESFENAAPTGAKPAPPLGVRDGPPARHAPVNPFAANGPRCGMVFELATAVIMHNAANRQPKPVAGKDGAADITRRQVELATLQHDLEAIAATIMAAICRAESGKVKVDTESEEVSYT